MRPSSFTSSSDSSERALELKAFVIKAVILACFTILPLLAAKLFIPMTWYSFRCWEPLVQEKSYLCGRLRQGFFYADQHCKKKGAQGDLAIGTRWAEHFDEEWFTDELGYRNRDYNPTKKYPVVWVGDSDIAGAGLTQEDTPAEALGRILGVDVYSWGMTGPMSFLKNGRFQRIPPSIVVMSENERNTFLLSMVAQLLKGQTMIPPENYSYPVPEEQQMFCSLLLLLPEKWQQYYLQMRNKPWLSRHLYNLAYRKFFNQISETSVLNPEAEILFYTGSLERIKYYEQNKWTLVHEVADAVESYNAVLKHRGIQMIYMPIPSKASVYWHLVPESYRSGLSQPDFLSLVVQKVKDSGIPAVDLTSVFRHAARNGEMIYHRDDVHWNAKGARLAAGALAAEIKRLVDENAK